MHFRIPPLVELIAELRWPPAGAPGQTDGQQPAAVQIPAALFAAFSRPDQMFMRFAGLIGAQGFVQSERLVPQGFPGLPFQPIYRYSRTGTKPGEPIFQLGPGVFSAHITPPYNSWDDFRPFLEMGISVLLEAREGAE